MSKELSSLFVWGAQIRAQITGAAMGLMKSSVVNLPHGMNGEKIVVIVEIYLDS